LATHRLMLRADCVTGSVAVGSKQDERDGSGRTRVIERYLA